MTPNRIIFIKGDFVDENIHKKIQNNYINKFNLILSDMSPNTIGHSNTDHLRIIEMSYEILELSLKFLDKDGYLVLKIFQGSNEQNFIGKLKKIFNSINYFKPKSSRKDSSEIYLILKGYKII